MPTLARFFGITIRMFFQKKEHNPPHIHVEYGDTKGSIDIKTGKALDGNLSKATVKIVKMWIDEHKEELLNIWNTQKFAKVAPLE